MQGSLAELLRQPGLVRPRYVDPASGETLPLADLVAERVLAAREPGQLVVVGPRGSGLSTALACAAEQVGAWDGAERRIPIAFEALLAEPGEVLPLLAAGVGVLLVDTSTTPIEPERWRAVRAAFRDGLPERKGSLEVLRGCRLIATCPAGALTGGERWGERLARPLRVELAPWAGDDLVELLASDPRYAPDRARVFERLRALPEAVPVLQRPRGCRLLVEAARRLAPDEPGTLGRLYATLLDTLAPTTIEALLTIEGDAIRVDDIQALLRAARLDLTEAAMLLELPRPVIGMLAAARRAERPLELPPVTTAAGRDALSAKMGELIGSLQSADEELAEWGGLRVSGLSEPLTLPGLHHFLQAGRCVQAVERGEHPWNVRAEWLPFVPELLQEHAAARLRAVLRQGPPRLAPGADAGPAALLVAASERLDFGERASVQLQGALLAGADLARTVLRRAALERADLRRADLHHADLSEAELERAQLGGARLVEASLRSAHLDQTSLAGADLQRARLDEARVIGATLHGACLRAIAASGSFWAHCELVRADLQDAQLAGAALDEVFLAEADLSRADLRMASLVRVDLRQVRLGGANLTRAVLRRCALDARALERLQADHAHFARCSLDEVDLHGASLAEALFEECRAHGARFDGADLRGAIFDRVDFQAGSSRAGLLLGKPALEGSMTGYYAEGASDDAWAPPEAIRQASFVGADLRGARFVNTDLFRVDLRGARLHAELRAQARAAGALLDQA